MPYARQLVERVAVAAVIDAQLANNTTLTSGYADYTKFARVLFILDVGATDTTVDFKLRAAKDTSGTGLADVTNAAITQISATGDNHQVLIELTGEALHSIMGQGFNYVKGSVTIGSGTTGANVCMIALGGDGRYESAKDYQVSTVNQTVVPS